MNFQHPSPSNETLQRFPEQQSKTWGTVISAVVTTAGSAMAANSQKKAAKKAAQGGQLDIAEINRLVSGQARDNALGSLRLEREIAPENQALRQTATRNLLASANRGTPEQDAALASVLAELQAISGPGFADSLRSSLFDQAVAQAGSDLALGGGLSTDVRNEVTRRGISNAGRVGGGNLGAARSVVPRDLGLSAQGLRTQRLNTAGQLGAQDASQRLGRFQTQTNAKGSLAQLIAQITGNRFNQQLGLANFGQSLQAPQTGLSPGNVADIYAGNQANALQGQLGRISANNAANQNYLQGLGSIFGALQTSGSFSGA